LSPETQQHLRRHLLPILDPLWSTVLVGWFSLKNLNPYNVGSRSGFRVAVT